MILAKYLSVVPTSNSTSCSQVSRSGLLSARPITNPFSSVTRCFKVAMFPPLLVSSSSLTVTPIYLSNIPMSSTSGSGSSIILRYSVSVGVVFSYPYDGYNVYHCHILLPSFSTPNPLKSSIMKLISTKGYVNA